MQTVVDNYNIRPIEEFAGQIEQMCYPIPRNWVELTKDGNTPFWVGLDITFDYLALILGSSIIYSIVVLFVGWIIYSLFTAIKNRVA